RGDVLLHPRPVAVPGAGPPALDALLPPGERPPDLPGAAPGDAGGAGGEPAEVRRLRPGVDGPGGGRGDPAGGRGAGGAHHGPLRRLAPGRGRHAGVARGQPRTVRTAMPPERLRFVCAAGLFLATLLTFRQAVACDFVNFDDPSYVQD